MVRSHSLSTFFILFFMVFALVMGVYSEFYQAPKIINHQIEEARLVFRENELDNIVEIRFKNRLGDFTLFRTGAESMEWQLTSPRNLPASAIPIATILSQLYNLKIRKIYESGPINTYNFSLDTPVLELDLKNQEGKHFSIRFGLINSIDNSTYILVNTKNAIYHIDGLTENLESIDLTKFIESKIAPYPQERVKSISFFKAQGKNRQLLFKAVQQVSATDTKEWVDENGNPVQEEAVIELLKNFLSVKIQTILDNVPEAAKPVIEKMQNQPLWITELELAEGTVVEYAISELVEKNLPELKLEKKGHFLISLKHLQYPYIVSKDYFKIWELFSAQKYKKIPVKKLFY